MTTAAPTAQALMALPSGSLIDVIAAWARERPGHIALSVGERAVTYAELDRLVDRIAAALQRDGVGPGDVLAIGLSTTSIAYVAAFLGAIRAGAAAAPLPATATAASLS